MASPVLSAPGFLRPSPCLPATDPKQCRAFPHILSDNTIVSQPLWWKRIPLGPFLIKTNKGWRGGGGVVVRDGGEGNTYLYIQIHICIYAYTINKASQPSPSGNFSSIYCLGGGFSSLPSHLLMKSPKPSLFLPPPPKGTHRVLLSGTLSPVVGAA